MTIRMSVKTRGLINPSDLRTWQRQRRETQRRAVSQAMREWGRPVVQKLQNQALSALKGRKAARTIRFKLHEKRLDRLPALQIFSPIPWLGIHLEGGTVRGQGKGLLIPLLEGGRIGRKRFKQIVSHIRRNNAGFFKEVNGKVILFAEYQPEYGKPLARFRRAERARQGGGRVKAGADIPIAVLVPQVTIRKRLDWERVVQGELPALASAIERRLPLGF